MIKKFIVKVYDEAGDFVIAIPESVLMSPIRFSSKINGGQGELVLDLNLHWDDPPSYASVQNYVRVYQVDTTNTTGRLIYSGKITQIEPSLSEKGSKISLVCLGLGSLLQNELYNAAHVAVDPAVIIAAIITDNQTDYPASFGDGWIGSDAIAGVRTGGQVDTVSTTVTFEFINTYWRDAVRKTIELTGGSWYWFIDAGGDFIFKEKPASADHVFTVGKDIDSISAPNSIEDIVNFVTVKYDGGTVTANDATSISNYGKRGKYQDETSGTSTVATAQNIADQVIAENKDPKKTVEIVLNDNYDLETIKVGETCKVQNLKKDSTVVSDNMQIVSINYDNGQFVALGLEKLTDYGTELESFIDSKV